MLFPENTVTSLSLINRYYTDRPEFTGMPRTTHTLGYQFSGCYRHSFDGGQAVFGADTFLFINTSSGYRVRTEEPGISISFHFTTREPLPAPFFAFRCGERPEVKKIFLLAYEHWSRGDGNSLFLSYSKLYEALAMANVIGGGQTDAAYIPSRGRDAVERALAHIRSHENEKINVAELAALSGISVRRFSELFRSVTSVTPAEYISDRRIARAKTYLEAGAFTVAETAEAVGIYDECYFNRLFKKKVGVSPGRYRSLIADGRTFMKK